MWGINLFLIDIRLTYPSIFSPYIQGHLGLEHMPACIWRKIYIIYNIYIPLQWVACLKNPVLRLKSPFWDLHRLSYWIHQQSLRWPVETSSWLWLSQILTQTSVCVSVSTGHRSGAIAFIFKSFISGPCRDCAPGQEGSAVLCFGRGVSNWTPVWVII